MRLAILIFFIFQICCYQNTAGQSPDFTKADQPGIYIKQDSMNLAILVLDFLTYEFIEGNMAYYPLCDSCDLDSLPFIIDFMYPMDYGEILFKYSYNSDTLFYASIWWMGTGHILYPDTFITSGEFGYQEEPIQLPLHAQYIDYWLSPHGYPWERFVEQADSAWNSIDSLEIIKEFSGYSYRVGIYAYTPVVGMFDPNYAKWIIFLYYGNNFETGLTSQINKEFHISAYPNPFNTSTSIEFELSEVSNIQFKIYNSIGEIVFRSDHMNTSPGKHSFTPSLQHLPAGMYYVVIKIDEGNSIIKMIKR